MAQVEDALFYPLGHVLGTGESAANWVTPATILNPYGTGWGACIPFQSANPMNSVRGVGASRISGAGYAFAYWNPAHSVIGPDQYAAAQMAIPEDRESNLASCRYDAARGATYLLSQLYHNWQGGEYTGGTHSAWSVGIYRLAEDGKTYLGGWTVMQSEAWNPPHPEDGVNIIDLSDLDYFRLDVMGQNPVKLRASVLRGRSQRLYPPYLVDDTSIPNPFRPMGAVMWRGPWVEDSSPFRILQGQPGMYGADQVQPDYGVTNGNSAFYAGDADWLTADVKSQTGSSVTLGGQRKSGSVVTVI